MATAILPVHQGAILLNGSGSAYQYDSSSKYTATVFMAPKAGTIDRCSVLLGSKAGSPGVLRVGLQGVSDGPANDGTWLASGNAYYDITSPVNGRVTVTLGSSVTVTAGQLFCLVVTPQSGTWDASNRISPMYALVNQITASVLPGPMYSNGSAWGRSGPQATSVPIYSDGTIPPGCTLYNSAPSVVTGWTSSANPLYLGNKWVATCNCTLRGIRPALRVNSATPADYNIKVFKDSSTTPIFTGSVDGSQLMQSGSVFSPLVLCNDLALVSGSTYRFVVEPTSANTFYSAFRQDFASASDRAATCGELIYTTAPSGATPWTDDDTKCFSIWPELYSVDLASGGSIITPSHATTGLYTG